MNSVLYLCSDKVENRHQSYISAPSPSVGIYLEDLLPMLSWVSSYLDGMPMSVCGPELSHHQVPRGSLRCESLRFRRVGQDIHCIICELVSRV